ncbi:MAG: hypothetical protein CL991_01895, partial [Euryarchaeota archaeon]|nr:hypothetical protein [Euryarchaeota archaeon]
MRAAWLVLLILLSTLPIPHVGAESTPSLTCPETVALVPGQATSVSFIQHGVGDATLGFDDLFEVEITDVVNTTEGDNRTWTGTFTATLDAPSGHLDLTVNLAHGGTTLSTCTVDVWIRAASALVLGASEQSTLTVNEG